jgi:hypothetical protein
MMGSGGRVRHARGATNPPRGLTAEALAAVDHDQIRLMIIGLLTESGITVSGLSPRGDHDELVLTIAPGWRPREGRARVFYRKVLKRDLTELATLGAQTALSEAILFEISGRVPGGFSVPEGVQFVPTAELIGRLEDAAAIKWDNAEPKVDRHLLARLKEVDKAPAWVDELGIRAIPVLARNKMPPWWRSVATAPDELFERLAFRMLTQVFRFGGTDLGATARMKREPDAILESPAATTAPFSAILDCKASRDGWGMNADDETRLANYVDARRAELAHPDEPFLIVLSSAFNAGTTAYEARRDAIRERCGARLVYWQASHLTTAALAIEKSRLDPAEREQLPWERYFAQGRPSGGIDTFTPEDTA